MDLISALAQTVIFLFASPDNTIVPVPIGTAFIVQYPIDNNAKQFIPFIVTAKHVVGNSSKVYGRFNTQSGSQTAMVEYNLTNIKASGDYWEHTDLGVDIAIFRTLNFGVTSYQSIPIDLIASKDDFTKEEIKQTDRVIFPGLLVNFLGAQKNYPIMKDGSIALIPTEIVPISYKVGSQIINTEQELILLNSISIPGLSGSPIFLYPGPRLKGNSFNIGGTRALMLGVMHGFYNALPREVHKVETTEQKFYYSDNSGIAIVFPSWRLREIFERPDFVKRIEELKRQIKLGSN